MASRAPRIKRFSLKQMVSCLTASRHDLLFLARRTNVLRSEHMIAFTVILFDLANKRILKCGQFFVEGPKMAVKLE